MTEDEQVTDDEQSGCGWEWDHDPECVFEDETTVQHVCRECGAEWWEDA
ncbi:hypothetical protein [Rathayibacter sp. Leaf299]|nr:hypothetical protein [Rathayibacter sp. Leaf299]